MLKIRFRIYIDKSDLTSIDLTSDVRTSPLGKLRHKTRQHSERSATTEHNISELCLPVMCVYSLRWFSVVGRFLVFH